jgi:hypothetical protein
VRSLHPAAPSRISPFAIFAKPYKSSPKPFSAATSPPPTFAIANRPRVRSTAPVPALELPVVGAAPLGEFPAPCRVRVPPRSFRSSPRAPDAGSICLGIVLVGARRPVVSEAESMRRGFSWDRRSPDRPFVRAGLRPATLDFPSRAPRATCRARSRASVARHSEPAAAGEEICGERSRTIPLLRASLAILSACSPSGLNLSRA